MLWDKYNYTVYKATIINTSKDKDSLIKGFSLGVIPQCAGRDDNISGGGVLDEDLLKWQYIDGKAVENTNPSMQNYHSLEGSFIGKINEGGVLIYDVTDVSEEDLENWDLVSFSNVTQPTLPYTIDTNRQITLGCSDTPIQADNSETATKINSRTYIFAVPYTTNITVTPERKDSFGEYQVFQVPKSYDTVYFGDGNYTWTKQYNFPENIYKAVDKFSHKKFVYEDIDGVETISDKKTVAIRGEGSSGFS